MSTSVPSSKRPRVAGDSSAAGPSSFEPAPARAPSFYQPRRAATPPRTRAAPADDDAPSKLSRRPVHGNYLAYYQKRRFDRDERLALLPKEWLEGKVILDVGCNSGVVDIEIAQTFSPAMVIGVDIDEALIKLAMKQIVLAWSRQSPLDYLTEAEPLRERPPHQPSIPARAPLPPPRVDPHYFPLALPRMFGYLTVPPRELLTTYTDQPEMESAGVTKKGKRKVKSFAFPENLRFETADWPNDEGFTWDKAGYDVIIGFSVTKWIHLNGLNAGLLTFFTRAFSCLRPGGLLILEPQPFSTYNKAAKFSDELKANYNALRDGEREARGWRDEEGDFERVLLKEVGFERKESLGDTGIKGFKRPVDVYFKRDL